MSQTIGRPAPETLGFAPPSARYGRMLHPLYNGHGEPDKKKLRTLALAMIENPKNTGSDNPAIPAAYTYFGQFIDHDLTLDLVSAFEAEIDPESTRNFRTAALELDSLYGMGPQGSPHLFQRQQPALFRVGEVCEPFENGKKGRDLKFDLPRLDDGQALLADARNDHNLFVNQLHVAFLRLHNHLVKHFLEEMQDPQTAFASAVQSLRWHYQWVVLFDYLPLIAGKKVVNDILRNGRRLYDPNDEAREAYLPIEFAAAAFRFGHAQVRRGYKINAIPYDPKSLDKEPAEIQTLDAGDLGWPPYTSGLGNPRASLRGGPVRERDIVDWSFMVGTDRNKVQLSRMIGPRLSLTLAQLPKEVFDRGLALPQFETAPAQPQAPGVSDIIALSRRNLMRGETFCLPDGQVMARFVAGLLGPSAGITVLTDDQLWSAPFANIGLSSVPLWFYLLREAQLDPSSNGERLGPLGARIVAEVLIGVLQKDPQSILNQGAGFAPLQKFQRVGEFDLTALLSAASAPLAP